MTNLERRQNITIRLPVELKEAVHKEADRRGISFNALIVILLRAGMKL